jgi:glycosyltransferase involved in cell wall biosynthesis
MSPAPLVSVIVPTYNRAHTLERALASVREQTCDDYELLVVDDHSTDDTALLLRRQCERDQRLRCISNTGRQGPSAARNAGLDQARGRYVAFLESDDAWNRSHLAQAVAVLERADVDIVFGDVLRVRDGHPGAERTRRGELRDCDLRPVANMRDCFVVGDNPAMLDFFIGCRPLVYLTTVVYERERLFARFDETHEIAEDLEFYMHLVIDRGARFGFVDATATIKFEDGDSMTGWARSDPARYFGSQLATYRALMDRYHARLDPRRAADLAFQTARQARGLARVYRDQGRYTLARRYFLEALRLVPAVRLSTRAKLAGNALATYVGRERMAAH